MKNPTHPRKTSILHLLAAASLLLIPLSASAAIVLEPTVVTGSDQINTLNRSLFYNSGYAAFEALPGYGTVQNINYTGTLSHTTPLILNYDQTDYSADVRFQFNMSVGTSSVTNSTYITSTGGNRLRLQALSDTNAIEMTIDFGIWDGDSFDPNKTVVATGFTLSGTFANLSDGKVVVTYYNTNNSVLNTQDLITGGSTTNTNNDRWGFTGWENTSGNTDNNIAYITVAFTRDSANGTIISLGDFGYTAIPEPSSLALLALGLGAVLLRRKNAKF